MKIPAMLVAVSVAMGLSALIPATASAQPGYMTCQAANAVKMRVFSTNEFVADSADADKAFDAYVKALQSEKIPMIGNLSDLQGICHWEAKKGVAAGMTANYVIHFAQMGYSLWTDVQMPNPFVP